MANKYAKEFQIPPGFAEILRDFAREVIRDQPDNIHAYGFQYFTEKLMNGGDPLPPVPLVTSGENRLSVKMANTGRVLDEDTNSPINRMTSGVGDDPNHVSNEELYDRISLMFDQADADGSGTLERREVEAIFMGLGEELGLTERDVLMILAEADENDDGVIEYREFVPMAVDVITALLAKEAYAANKELRESGIANDEARDYLLKGMPQQELESAIRDVFFEADKDGNGTLDRAEFLRVLKESGLGFTRREINIILTMVDRNGDGLVQYEEFIPICLSMLVEVLTHEMQQTPPDEQELARIIRENLYAAKQLSGSGGGPEMIDFREAFATLTRLDLGLTRVQLHAIMSSVEQDRNEMVQIPTLAETAAGVIISLKEWSMRGAKSSNSKTLGSIDSYRLIHGMDIEGFRKSLWHGFENADIEGSGGIDKNMVRSVIENSLPQLSQNQVQALLSIAYPDEDGIVDYNEIINLGFQTLQSLRTQMAVKEAQANGSSKMLFQDAP